MIRVDGLGMAPPPVAEEVARIVAGEPAPAVGKRLVLKYLQAQWLDRRGFWRDFEDADVNARITCSWLAGEATLRQVQVQDADYED